MPSELISQTDIDAPLEVVGGKAKGLLKIKPIESELNEGRTTSRVYVPRFFIVPIGVSLIEQYQTIVEAARKLASEKFAVRSSSTLEDVGEHSFDGIFTTERDVTLDQLVRSISRVRKSATSPKARAYADEKKVELTGSLPVIVQADVQNSHYTGIAYSKFPSPYNITKVVRDCLHGEWKDERFIEAFERKTEKGHDYISYRPFIFSREGKRGSQFEAARIADIALEVEQSFGYPIILEFAYHIEDPKDKYWTAGKRIKVSYNPEGKDIQVISLLQGRRLTNIDEATRFQIPELQEDGLVAMTYDINGVGDVSGKAFVVRAGEESRLMTRGLRKFDTDMKGEGYILVTHHVEFWGYEIDSMTPNKKGILAYSTLGKHHDMEIARKRGLVYLNCGDVLSTNFRRAGERKQRKEPIKTGDQIRLVSDGVKGFVYNLSRYFPKTI